MESLTNQYSDAESRLIGILNDFTRMLEKSPSMIDFPVEKLFKYFYEIFMYPLSEPVLMATLKCILVFVSKNPTNCFKIIDYGIYNKLLSLLNPSSVNSAITITVAIEARNIIARMGTYEKVFQYPKFNYLKYDLFLENFYEFPIAEQKNIIEFTQKLTKTYLYDYYLPSIMQLCPLLTHFDSQIVSDSVKIILSYTTRANLSQLKIVDPLITQKIALAIELIEDELLIVYLLAVIEKFCQVSYEYAESLIDLPIDFGLIIDHLGPDPWSDAINVILRIIRQIFSFQTLRKSDTRNQKLARFAYVIQPVLIKILSLNSSDMNLVLDCLLVTFDAYFPFKKINSILDDIAHIISSGNKNLKVDAFYKKIVENQKIKDGIEQYEMKKLPQQIFIPHTIDLNTFNDIQKVHSSSFAISEQLQNSILYFLKGVNSSFDLSSYKETLLKIVDFCQKTIVFNVRKAPQKTNEQMMRDTPQVKRFTIYNSSGQMLSLCIPEFVNLSICECFFNYVHLLPNQRNANLQNLSNFSIDHMNVGILLNHIDKMIDINLNDLFISTLSHNLCFKSNQMIYISRSVNSIISNSESSQLDQLINNRLINYKFYQIKADGKTYSVYDTLFHIISQTKTNQFEMIELPKYNSDIREADFLIRKDIKNHSSIKQIKFDAFHESFTFAYPTLNLQRKSFEYYQKSPIAHIETCFEILKEIYRLCPELKNAGNENAFENEILGLRLLEKINFSGMNSMTSSAFIRYPFIFTLEDRLLFLKLTSLSFFHMIYTLVSDVYIKSNKPFLPVIRMNINIDRETLLNSGFIVFNLLSTGGISLNVKFDNESGTGIGPTQEFFRLFALKLQLNSLDIWLSDKSPTSNETNEKETHNQNDDNNNNNNESKDLENGDENTSVKIDRPIFSTFEDIFAEREGELGLFPSPHAVRRPDLFFTLGSLCAKAIEMEIVLPLRFSPAFFKLIRHEQIELEEVSKHYSRILNQANHEGLIGLPFTVPGRFDIELRKGGQNIITDENNVELYVELLKRVLTFDVDKKINNDENSKTGDIEEISPLTPKSSNAWSPSLQKTMSTSLSENSDLSPLSSNNLSELSQSNSSPQIPETTNNSETNISKSDEKEEEIIDIPFDIANFIEQYSFDTCCCMFREGFGRIISWESMNLFTSEEICFILSGEDDLSIETLRNFVDIGNEFETDCQLIEWLFEIISKELTKYEKKLFSRFITGSDTFGIFGLKSLKPRLTISKSTKSENSLPSSSTCTHNLKIPEYSNKKLLKQKLLYALYECNQSFYS